jgi:pimeloyl-ACP methyl ester carboxylesterase/MFS family permease
MSAPEPALHASKLSQLKQLSGNFWTLYASSCLIDLGLCLYFFLFSLFLVEHGVSELNIGFITAAQTIGTIAGTILISFLTRRLELRTMMLIYVFAAPLCLASRVFSLQIPFQIATAFVAGAMMSIWSVCFSPTLAKLTTRENRAFGFSIFVATGIASGALAGVLGGYIPGLLRHHAPYRDGIKAVLLLACFSILLAAFSILRLRLRQDEVVQRHVRVFSSFLVRFLIAITAWNFALSFFTPFANVYLSRHLGLPLMRIGQIYTTSQLIMVVTVMMAPLLYRKVGLVSGVAITQFATALLLWALSRASGGSGAIGIYLGLTAVQWMGGPGISSLLMNRTPEMHRSQASAMLNMANLAAQAGAAALAGKLFERYGYSGPLAANAALAALAGVLLYTLLGKEDGAQDAGETVQPQGSDGEALSSESESESESAFFHRSESVLAKRGRSVRSSARWAGVLGGACLLLLLPLSAWNLEMTEWQHMHNPAPGDFYSVEGRQMHLYCSGAGSPTIVIEAGLGNDWLNAQEVQPELSRLTRVCTYDRSGLGWSEPRSGPRDAATIARQLHALLDAAGVQRPLVLTGHSGGGIYVREFASEFPAEVVGVVLVDSASPQQFEELPGFRDSYEEFVRSAPGKLRWKKLRVWSGLQRLAGRCQGRPPEDLKDMAAQYDAEKCRTDYEGGDAGEYVDFAEAAKQVAHHTTLGGKPLLILSEDPDRRTEETSSAEVAVFQAWDREQEALKSLSPMSWRVIARGSAHGIYQARPDAVVAEMSRLIVYLRGGPAPEFGSTKRD